MLFQIQLRFPDAISSVEGSHRQEVTCDQPNHTMQAEEMLAIGLIRAGQTKRSKEMRPALTEV